MSHTLKLILKIIHNRIYRKLEEGIGDIQFGFREGYGAHEALFAFNILTQGYLDLNQNIFACFIESKQLDIRDIRIISRRYYNQKAVARIETNTTKEIQIKRGVTQGCVFSPILFNFCSEENVKRHWKRNKLG